VAKLRAGDVQGANRDWEALATAIRHRRDGTDLRAVALVAVRQAYLDVNPPLRDAADRVRLAHETREAISRHLAALRGHSASLRGGARVTVPAVAEVRRFQPGRDSLLAWRQASMSKSELDAYLKAMEEKLNAVGDDAQLANVDLQNQLQKQQQTLQMLSTISKQLSDTAMAVIRKIGG
jgi:hypothetical protein